MSGQAQSELSNGKPKDQASHYGTYLGTTKSEYQSENINELAAALVELQYKLEGAKKDSKNPFFKSTYADLESCMEALREPLHENGLAVTQTSRIVDGVPVLVTTLLHKSGQWIRGELPIFTPKSWEELGEGTCDFRETQNPQKQGAAITYARRYALCAITGLCQVDDDAESAIERPERAVPQDAPKCPKCGVAALRRSTYANAGGKFKGEKGWYCYGKIGGCNAKWDNPESPAAGVYAKALEIYQGADVGNQAQERVKARQEGAVRALDDYKGQPMMQEPVMEKPARKEPELPGMPKEEEPFPPLPKEQQVTSSMMTELMAKGKENGWSPDEIEDWIFGTYQLEQSTFTRTFTRDYWHATMEYITQRKPGE